MQDLYGEPADDGLLIRDSPRWTLDKLAVVECYVSGFSRACTSLPTWQVVDGFAGPGINRVKPAAGRRGEPTLHWGTPILCYRADPPIPHILAMDYGTEEVAALRARTSGIPRITVTEGDVNEDLLPRMTEALSRRAATLCILDPEGTELDFDRTVAGLSRWRISDRYKVELLILFPTYMGFQRMLPLRSEFDWAPEKMDRMFGTGADWRSIWQRRRRSKDKKASRRATREYVGLYADQLKGLGYKTVLDREVRLRGREGRPGYSLIFATDNDTGENIMDWCFDNEFPAQDQLPLFKLPRSSHLRDS